MAIKGDNGLAGCRAEAHIIMDLVDWIDLHKY